MTEHSHNKSCPCSQEPQDIEKRNFIKGLTGAVLGFMTFFLTMPFISYLIPVSTESSKDKFIKVPNFPAVPIGIPTKMNFEDTDTQAFITNKIVYDVWVIKQADDKAVVYSPICPHLSCRYTFVKNQFSCPCHGSIFNEEGKVLGGPSPRPLDTLPYKIEAGDLYVQWKQFKAGSHDKIEA